MSATVQVLDKSFVPFLDAETIDASIATLAAHIKADYGDKTPLFIAILNGSFMFSSDLFKKLDFPAEICFIKLASYKGTKSSGHVITAIGLDTVIKDRHVIILEDIVDTGLTLVKLREMLEAEQPASVRICALLVKPEKHQVPVNVDYTGFVIPDKFVVGYGLDLNEYGRNLPHIYQLK